MKRYKIYSLNDPKSDEIRYIGITITKLHLRLTQHVCQSRKIDDKTHRANWIRKLSQQGLKPIIKLIEETNDVKRESYWINYYREKGMKLVNSSNGCESHIGYIITQETRKKIGEGNRGKTLSESHKQILIKSNTGRKMSENNKSILIKVSMNRKNSAIKCCNGHEYTPENTVTRKDGYRECKLCNIAKKKRYNERRKKLV